MSEPSNEPPPELSGPLIVFTPVNTALIVVCLLVAAFTSLGHNPERPVFFSSATGRPPPRWL